MVVTERSAFGDDPDASAVPQFVSRETARSLAYGAQVLQRAIRDEPGLTRRVFPEFTYRTRYGERKTSDVVLVYPRTAIFLDATAMRIRFEATAVSTDVAAFDTDVDQIVDKAKQLTERIRDFRAGLYDFGGVTGRDFDSIYPVIVTIQSIPESTVIWGRIRDRLASQGLLTDPGVEPLPWRAPLILSGAISASRTS